ncbi:MAG: ABC transporter ATP-binding protein [Pseudomonadota bacterium]|jgi:putative ABC transport system ATP-binding protein
MSLISLVSIEKVFYRGDERITAIRDLSLSIAAGEFVAIRGASGSGKSTLLYIMGLLDRATSGSYELNGKLVDTLSDDQRAQLRNAYMGFIFQSFHLLPRASALRNVMMPLVYASSYGINIAEREQRARAERALETVGLADRVNHVPNQLSGGQRQRVAIARALVNNPSVIFADEPTGNLDSKSGREILTIFERLNAQGVTIIMVTHDPAIAERAKRQLVLGDGALIGDSYAT